MSLEFLLIRDVFFEFAAVTFDNRDDGDDNEEDVDDDDDDGNDDEDDDDYDEVTGGFGQDLDNGIGNDKCIYCSDSRPGVGRSL